MLYDFFIVLNLIALCYVWFMTDAVPEWASILRLNFLKYKEYFKKGESPLPFIAAHTYTEFLEYNYGNRNNDSWWKDVIAFCVRLITCVECGIVWFNIIAYLIFGVCLHKMPLLLLGPNVIMTWLGYNLLRRTLIKLNEQ